MSTLYLLRKDFITINRKTAERHGGNYVPPENLLHGDALEYLVDTVQADIFGQPLYPSISDKAGLYLFNVISNHVFQDGNKRTGLEAALLFLSINGRNLGTNLTGVEVDGHLVPNKNGLDYLDHLIAFTLAVASGQVPLPACQQWFTDNITKA